MKKWIGGLLSLALILSMAACGSPGIPDTGRSGAGESAYMQPLKGQAAKKAKTTKDYTDGVVKASYLTVKNGVAFWGYDGQLCSALLDDKGNLYDFLSEGKLSAEIYSIALDGSDLYMATKEGLVCLPLEESDREQSFLSVIDTHSLSNSSFSLYGDELYFTYGYSLYKVPKEGGKSKVLEENIIAFQVTTEGVYCLNKRGELIRVSLDGKERKTLAELDSEGELFIFKDKAYITTGDDKDYIYLYDLGEDSWEKLHFEKDLSPYHPVWVTEDGIYYESEDYEIYCRDSKTGKESQSDVLYDLPDYASGYLEGKTLYSVDPNSLYWMHLDSGESVKLSKEEALNRGAAAASPKAQEEYDIAEDIGVYNSQGQARLESKYFTLYLPADGDWSYEVIDKRTVDIYYCPAYEAGYGGLLVTIKAFDWGDNAYEDLPSYTIAGLGADKKYIAVFPTDAQFDPKQAAEYSRLFQYVQRIDSGEGKADSNPFSCR